MNKMKKILLGVAPVLAISGMAATAISCGKTRFDQKDDGQLVIASGFADGNAQGKGLKAVVEAYNVWLKADGTSDQSGAFPTTAAEKVKAGYLPVRLTTLTNGYDTGPLQLRLKSKDQDSFWNMLINYPAAASILSYYDMNTAISNELYDTLGIAPTFKEVNKNIPGNEKDEIWTVPLTRSSEMSSINKLVFGKMLKELKDSFHITVSGTKVEEYITAYESNATDKSHIDALWQPGKAPSGDNTKVQTLINKKLPLQTINDDIFNSYDKLVNVALAMKAMYPNNNYAIVGLDSLPNAINLMTTAMTNGNPLDGYVKKDGNVFDYSLFFRKGTKQYEFFKSVVSNIVEAISKKAVQVFGAGSYGSNDLTKHKMGISIGSTAGYSHTFFKSDNTEYIYKLETTNKNIGSRPFFLVPKSGSLDAKQVGWFTNTDGKYTNKIFEPGAKNVGGHDSELRNANIVAKIKSLLSGTTTKTFSASKSFTALGAIVSGEVVGSNLNLDNGESISLDASQKSQIQNLGEVFLNSEAKYVYIPASLLNLTVETTDASQLLNQAEADWLASPRTKTLQGEKQSIWSQGPSLIPIHANEREDKGTQLFVKWLYTYINPTLDSLTNVTGLIAFNKKGNYIAPTVEFLNDVNNSNGMNAAEKIAFDGFHLTLTEPNTYITAEDIPSKDSPKFRSIITSIAKNAYYSNTPITFDKFISDIEIQFK